MIDFILNNVIMPCSRGLNIISSRPMLEGVHAFLCAKEISEMIQNGILILETAEHIKFVTHNEGKQAVVDWATKNNLDYDKEINIAVGIADVVVYADDLGVFEIGTARPSKILLMLKYIVREKNPISAHFWPYDTTEAFVFKNWK